MINFGCTLACSIVSKFTFIIIQPGQKNIRVFIVLARGGGTWSKLGAQLLNRDQNLDAQNLLFPSLMLKYWVRKCAPLRIRLLRPCMSASVL